MRWLSLATETIWRDFLQPTMCRPRTADIWTEIHQGRAACQPRSRQLSRCYCNATSLLLLWDANYGTKTRRQCGSMVLATLYVSAHSLCSLLELNLCKSTIVARQQQDQRDSSAAWLSSHVYNAARQPGGGNLQHVQVGNEPVTRWHNHQAYSWLRYRRAALQSSHICKEPCAGWRNRGISLPLRLR